MVHGVSGVVAQDRRCSMTTLLLGLTAALLFSGGLVLVLLRHAAKADDVYPPEAAEAPDPVDAQHDEYERAKYFTEEEAARPEAAPPPPVVVAGDDLRMSILMGQIERACFEYREGVDICADAPREPSPEVQR